ncbi:hypothetical protein [Shewanella waksmanii]|nr:hypothetical protein [Shewanella waksmanii]
MANLLKLILLLGLALLGYQQWFAPLPLQTYSFTNVPVTVAMLYQSV